MSLPYAILTALAEKSGSGLDLARRFDKSIGYFWSATHQQIYRELARLEKSGLIDVTPQPGARGGRRIYRLLPAGRDALMRWVPQDEPIAPLRNSLMVRLRAEAALGPTGLAPALREQVSAHREKLARYREIQTQDFATTPHSRDIALQGLILEAGIRHETNWIEVLEQALVILET